MCNGDKIIGEAFGFEFCQPCFDVLGDEDAMDKRIKWEDGRDG
jgi:hypothetical protein